eukprot:12445541-Ditylum_brightwellii.AAC.1
MEPIDTLIGKKFTKDKWKGKVAKWHKFTTTSPSGRHLDHFKALMCRFAEDLETEEGKEIYCQQEGIIDAH